MQPAHYSSPSEELAAAKARIRDLEAALGLTDPSLAVTFKLSAGSHKLLALLMSSSHVTSQMVQKRLEIATDTKVAMHRLRVALKPFGTKDHRIEIKNRRTLGYFLEPETKAFINSLVTQGVTETPEEPAPDHTGAIEERVAA